MYNDGITHTVLLFCNIGKMQKWKVPRTSQEIHESETFALSQGLLCILIEKKLRIESPSLCQQLTQLKNVGED